MSDNLEQLGSTGFQDLAACLAIAEFGAGVEVMGPGRDGGRDLRHRGALIWKPDADQPGEVWDGYTVLQAKHMAALSTRHQDNLAWLWGRVREELEEWADPDGDRNPVPDYLIIITNVMMTPFPVVGGRDALDANIAAYLKGLEDDTRDTGTAATTARMARLKRLSRIKKVRVWDGHQVKALLKVHRSVRDSFPGFLTAGDVFAALGQFTDNVPIKDLEGALREHAQTTITGEGVIYFDEAGSGDRRSIPIHEVAIDLPVTATGSRRTSVVKYVLDRAEHVLKPDVTVQPGPRHLIVTGAPGNGKTTISKFLVQVFRAAMLNGTEGLGDGHRSIITGTELALRRFGRTLPKHRRWPMRIDLAEYVQEGGLTDDSTLLKWIAHKVSRRSNSGDVKAGALKSWLHRWPWLLVLDGLDEVTEPAIRKRLIERVTEFVNDAETDKCDVLVVLTTRPVGYTENIAPAQFERIDLDYLELDQAVRYGERATKVRLGADLDRIDRVLTRLRQAAKDESLQHLLRTPLQVLILTIIVDGSGQLAPDRYSLFYGYYDTVFRRERDAKTSSLRQILLDHGQHIQQLHERVGFELQRRGETGDHSYATLTYDELRKIAWQVLNDVGFKPDGKDAPLLDKIVDAATKRLVLIAPRGDAGYGFDVRSLQELMAAMHLTADPLDAALQRLRTAAPSPYWRNTWLFAAGQLFSTPQPHRQEAVVNLVETIDENADDRLGLIAPVGPRLALEVIDDGMARSYPRWRDRLIAHAMKVLGEPNPPDLPTIAKYLVRFANTGDEQRTAVAEGLRDALGGTQTARQTAAALQQLIPSIADGLHAHGNVRGLHGVRKRPNAPPAPEATDGWENFEAELTTYPCDEQAARRLHKAAEAIRYISRKPARDQDATALLPVLVLGPAKALVAALQHVVDHEPDLVVNIRDGVLPGINRMPIGQRLQSDTADPT